MFITVLIKSRRKEESEATDVVPDQIENDGFDREIISFWTKTLTLFNETVDTKKQRRGAVGSEEVEKSSPNCTYTCLIIN